MPTNVAMTPHQKEAVLETMVSIARKAGGKALSLQRNGDFGVTHKRGAFGTDFVSKGDLAAQQIILDGLTKAYPKIPIISEEQPNKPTIPSRAFVIDPIDGTLCYIRNANEWGVMITLLEQHRPEIAVIFIPARNMMATAIRGEGCKVDGQRVTLTPATQYAGRAHTIMIGMELGPWWTKDWRDEKSAARLIQLPLQASCPIRSMLSGAYGIIALLRGETNAWLSVGVGDIWDFTPGALMVTEASGEVRLFSSQYPRFEEFGPMNMIYASDRGMLNFILEHTVAWLKANSPPRSRV